MMKRYGNKSGTMNPESETHVYSEGAGDSKERADIEEQHNSKERTDHKGNIEGIKQRRNSLIFIASLSAVLIVLFMLQRKAVPDSGLVCVIQIDGEQVHTMELNRDGEYRAEDSDGHYNIVVVKDGTVRVTEADCANQICVQTGGIRNPGEVIACLPHRMIIYIEDGTN